MFKFDTQQPSRYGIMKRRCQNVDEIMWFEMPNHWAFHYINAWEDKNNKNEDIVVFWGCTLKDVELDFHLEHPFYGDNNIEITKMTFNLETGKSSFEKYEPGFSGDFPIIP